MLKPTLAKLALSALFLTIGLGPMFVYGNGPALILPVMEIFWLAWIAMALGVPVVVTRVDAFALAAPNAIGVILIVVGFAISVAVNYALASFIVWSRS